MVNDRIAHARRFSGLSLREVATAVGKSHTYVSQIEKGTRTPDSSVLGKLANLFNLNVEYFFRPLEITVSQVSFRKRAGLPSRIQERILEDVREQAERFFEICNLFPESPINSFAHPVPEMASIESPDQIESVAQSVRSAWNLGLAPIPSLMRTLEEQGILVCATTIESDTRFDGLTLSADGHPVIAIGATWHGDRQRFTLSHELGHLLLDERLAAGIQSETAANRFAGAFLAPAEAVYRELGEKRKHLSLPELYDLKHLYGLSMQGWVFRAADLGIVTPEAKQRMFKMMSTRGWKKNEPGEPVPSEDPSLMESLVFRALSEGIVGNAKAAELLGQTQAELAEQLSLENAHARHW